MDMQGSLDTLEPQASRVPLVIPVSLEAQALLETQVSLAPQVGTAKMTVKQRFLYINPNFCHHFLG